MPGHDIVLLAGQSNMVGYGYGRDPAIDDATDPRIEQIDASSGQMLLAAEPLRHPKPISGAPIGIGMGMSFAKLYLAQLPSARRVLLVPAALGATGFLDDRWNPGDDLFERTVARMVDAVGRAPGNCVAALLWHQGETDAMRGADEVGHAARLDRLIVGLRQRIPGAATAPFILGGMVPLWMASRTPAQLAVAAAIKRTPERMAYTAFVGSEGLTSNRTQGVNDTIHFDAASQRVLGRRYFSALPKALAQSPSAISR